MKKTFYFVLLTALAFLLLGCPSPNAPVNFTVTYSTEKGTAPEPITVEEDTVLTAEQLKPITTEGFIFKGWFDGETQAVADEYKVTADVTLTAKWEVVPPTEYSVTYETAHGTIPTAIPVEENTVLTAGQLTALKAEGFIFKGWFDGETEAKAGEYKVTKNVTLTAKWVAEYTVSYSTKKSTAPESFKVEENTVLTAEQLKALTAEGFIFKGWFDGETEAKAGEYIVTKNVTLTAKWDYPTFNNTKQFPFESGKEYKYESENIKDVFVFNSDGTARYEEFKKDTDSTKNTIWKIREGYEYHYVADTEKQLIYLYLEKSYFKDELGIFENSYMTLDEVSLVIDSYLNEEKLRQLIINSDTLKPKIIDSLVKMKFKKSTGVTNEEIEKYKATITDDDIWNTFLEDIIHVPQGLSVSDYMSMLLEAEFNGATSIFNTILEYHYEEDDEGLKLTQVVYDNATLKDMITSVSAGKLCSELTLSGHSKINIDQNFEYFGEGEINSIEYTISTLKDGEIYCFPIPKDRFSKHYEGTNYKIEIDPIPYTETGKGEDLVVTITFEGSKYKLTVSPNNNTCLYKKS